MLCRHAQRATYLSGLAMGGAPSEAWSCRVFRAVISGRHPLKTWASQQGRRAVSPYVWLLCEKRARLDSLLQ